MRPATARRQSGLERSVRGLKTGPDGVFEDHSRLYARGPLEENVPQCTNDDARGPNVKTTSSVIARADSVTGRAAGSRAGGGGRGAAAE
jgi:hypothetical protein